MKLLNETGLTDSTIESLFRDRYDELATKGLIIQSCPIGDVYYELHDNHILVTKKYKNYGSLD